MGSTSTTAQIDPADEWLTHWSDDQQAPSLAEFLKRRPHLTLREFADVLLVDQQMRWRDSSGPSVQDYLEQFPVLTNDSEVLLDLIAGEIRATCRLGRPATVDDFVARYPQLSDAIRRQFELTDWIHAQSAVPEHDGPLPFRQDPQQGADFGDYILQERIGSGGMGSIFQAKHRAGGGPVAIKILHADRLNSAAHRERFRNESATIARLQHPNILPVYEVGEVDETPYFTTRLISPGSLEQYASRLQNKFTSIAATIQQISLAVHFAHQHGVLHRDLKPSNVLVDENGNPYVCDFGLARLMGDQHRVTVTGDLIGTPVWMPPEVVERYGAEYTIAGDVYGLGTILYFLLTQQAPYTTETLVETLYSIRDVDPPCPRQLQPNVPADLEMICRRAMDRTPARRYHSAGALAEDLGRYLDGQAINARPVPWWEKQRRHLLLHPVWSTIGIASVILLVAVGGYTFRLSRLNTELGRLVTATSIANRESARARSEASSAREAALELQDDAQSLQRLAAQARDDRQQLLYAAQMRLAWTAWRDGDMRQAGALLSESKPAAGDADLRGFEWFYLNRLASPPASTFRTNGGEARCIDLSADEQRLAVGRNDGTIELFDVVSGKPVGKLKSRQTFVRRLKFDRHSDRLAAGDDDGTIAIYNTTTLRLERTLKGPADGMCRGLVFLNDGRQIVAGHRDPCLRVWSLLTGEQTRQIPVTAGDVQAVSESADGRRIALAADTTVQILDTGTLNPVHSIVLDHESPGLQTVALSGDGTRAVVGRYDNTLRVIDFSGNEPRQLLLLQLLDDPRAVSISTDGKTIAACDYNGTVHAWRVPDEAGGSDNATTFLTADRRHLLSRAVGHAGRGYDVKLTADGSMLYSAGQDGNVRQCAAGNQYRPGIVTLHDITLREHPPLQTGKDEWLVLGETDLARISRSPKEFQIVRQGSVLSTMDYYPASDRAAMVDAESGLLRIGDPDVPTEALIQAQEPDRLKCQRVIFSPDGSRIAVVDWQYDRVVVLSAATGDVELNIPARQCQAAAWAHDGHRLAFTVMDDVIVVSARNGQQLNRFSGHTTTVTMLAWSPDDATIATVSKDRSVCLWNVPESNQRRRMFGHRDAVSWVIFSPDGRSLVTADRSGIVKVWQSKTGEQIGDLWTNPDFPVTTLQFSADGNSLVGVSPKGALIYFDTSR